jgi:hypothetical protein
MYKAGIEGGIFGQGRFFRLTERYCNKSGSGGGGFEDRGLCATGKSSEFGL